VDYYRRPQLARSWDEGMVAFLCARLSGSLGLGGLLKSAFSGGSLEDQYLAQVRAGRAAGRAGGAGGGVRSHAPGRWAGRDAFFLSAR
jgi:hypothetical protein